MRNRKLIKVLTMALGCLMLTLTISTGLLNHSNSATSANNKVFHTDQDAPNGWINKIHII